MTKICNKDLNRDESSNSSIESNGLPVQGLTPKRRQRRPCEELISTNKVKKSSTAHKMDVSNEEMQSLLAKLKKLVPYIPRNKKLTKLEIIQNVIDYIFDLQLALESHPQSICQSSPPSLTPFYGQTVETGERTQIRRLSDSDANCSQTVNVLKPVLIRSTTFE